MADIKLLLIEDDEDDYIITRDLLADIHRQPFILDWFPNIDQAREALARNAHDVCLLDYSLGEVDGLSLLREASLLGFKGPIIMLTGQDSEELDVEAQSAGAVDYLVKSQLTAAHLARAIRYAISRRETETARFQRHKAEAENRAKSEFLAQLSHELRTPLTSILGYTDLLLANHQASKRYDFLRIIKNNGNHLSALLNDVTDLSKIEAGKIEIEPQNFNLHELLAELFHLLEVRAHEKQLQLQFEAAGKLPLQIVQDPIRLRQILLNLLSNALKFTDRGGVNLAVAYAFRDDCHWLAFSVTDTGIGIHPEESDTVFQAFVQSKNVVNRPDKGSGLGLAISQRLANTLGGNITMESEPGHGSTFTLEIPFELNQPLKLTPLDLDVMTVSTPPQEETPLQGRVLVVDDVSEIRFLVGCLIVNAGLAVDYAENGEQALQALLLAQEQGRDFDLAVIDLQMPGLSGLDLAKLMHQKSLRVPAIALTAATMKGQREQCLEAGFAEYLPKPVDARQLYQAVRHQLQKQTNPTGDTNVLSPVLLIEDDADSLDSTSLLLRMLHCQVRTAGNAAEALNDLRVHGPPALILSDIELPDMSGKELSLRLRNELGKQVRLVALSGHDLDSPGSEQHAFDAVYLKPVTLETLKQIIRR